MKDAFIPKLQLTSVNNPFKTSSSNFSNLSSFSNADMTGRIQSTHLAPISNTSPVSFKNILNNTLSNVNKTLQAPDALMQESMTTGGVDVHDVMIANAKADLVINVTAQMTTKVIQAYDRILQIQI